jgi:hypothetical protein
MTSRGVAITDDAGVQNIKDKDKVSIIFPSKYKKPSGKRVSDRNKEAIQQQKKLNEQQKISIKKKIDEIRADYVKFKSNYQGTTPATNYFFNLKKATNRGYPEDYNILVLARGLLKNQLEAENLAL